MDASPSLVIIFALSSAIGIYIYFLYIYSFSGRGNGALQMAVDVLRRGADKKLRQFMSIIGSFTCGVEFLLGVRGFFGWVAGNREKSLKIPSRAGSVICWGKTNNGIFSCYPIQPIFFSSFKFVTG